ncbi:MAG: hypothetical protein AAFU79_07780, partial [Myxococcota bacterium]
MRRAWLCLAAAAVVACRSRAVPEAKPEASPLSGLLVGGCRDLLNADTCLIDQSTKLTLWAPAPRGLRLEAFLDGKPQVTEWTRVEGGLRGALTVTPTVSAVRVLARSALGVKTSRELHIKTWKKPAALDRVMELYKTDPEKAKAELASLDDAEDPRTQVEAMIARAKLSFREGDFEAASKTWRKAAALADEQGWPDTAARARGPVIFTALDLHPDFRIAREVLDNAASGFRSPYASLVLANYEGKYQRALGDKRVALRRILEAERLSRKVGERSFLYVTTQARAALYGEAGLHSAGLEALRSAEPPANAGCPLGWWVGNEAWQQLMSQESGTSLSGGSPLDSARRSVELFESDCPQPQALTNSLSILALAHARDENWSEADRVVSRAMAREGSMPINALPWLLEVRARVAVATKRFSMARDAYLAMGEFAQRAGLVRWQWRAAVGMAQILGQAGKTKDALRSFERAEALLARWKPSTLLPSGSTVWGVAVDRAAEAHATLLLESGKREQAAEVLVRRTQRRMSSFAMATRIQRLSRKDREAWEFAAQRYASLRVRMDALIESAWSEDDWRESEAVRALGRELEAALDDTIAALGPQVPLRPLETPADGELVLGYEALGGCVLAFASSSTGREVRRLDCPEDRVTGPEGWLKPFEEFIRRARSISVHAQGRVRAVDLHLASFEGSPLGATRSVAYSVGSPDTHQAEQEVALRVVASDPTGDLPRARDEGDWVARRLRGAGWTVEERRGRDVERRLLAKPTGWLHWA